MFLDVIFLVITFVASNETEIGSAEEQPIRDNLMSDERSKERIINKIVLLTYSELPMPEKTYS